MAEHKRGTTHRGRVKGYTEEEWYQVLYEAKGQGRLAEEDYIGLQQKELTKTI